MIHRWTLTTIALTFAFTKGLLVAGGCYTAEKPAAPQTETRDAGMKDRQ